MRQIIVSTYMEYLCLSPISVIAFYKQLCSILGVSDKRGKADMFQAFQEQITYLNKKKRQPLLFAIDEAQYLNTGILNDIKMSMNYGYDSAIYFTLILRRETHHQRLAPQAGARSTTPAIPRPLQLYRTFR